MQLRFASVEQRMSVITLMSKVGSQEKWRIPSVSGPCACSASKGSPESLTALRQVLGASGLTVTQYALLVHVTRAGEVSRTALAIQLGMVERH